MIKAGIGEGSIRTCFCTGVLPVTMDDLTSGYNIAEILTLEPNFLNMLGFYIRRDRNISALCT